MFDNKRSRFKFNSLSSILSGLADFTVSPAIASIAFGTSLIAVGMFSVYNALFSPTKKAEDKPDACTSTDDASESKPESTSPKSNRKAKREKSLSCDSGGLLQTTANLFSVLQNTLETVENTVKRAARDANKIRKRTKKAANKIDKKACSALDTLCDAGLFAYKAATKLAGDATQAANDTVENVQSAFSGQSNN